MTLTHSAAIGSIPQHDRQDSVAFARQRIITELETEHVVGREIDLIRVLVNPGREESVPRHRRIDPNAPGIDPASHALAGGYAPLSQPMRHIQAAYSVVTEDNQSGVVGLGFQLLQACWDISHRDQRGALDARDGKFLRFANVNQHYRFSRIYSALDVFRAGFYWEDRFIHESEDSAMEKCLSDTLR